MRLQRRYGIALVLVLALLSAGAGNCSSSDTHKVKVKVDQAAHVLNTAAHSNRSLYQSHVITLAQRQQVAKAIYDANEYLSDAVEAAAVLQPGQSGASVLALLQQALTALAQTHIGNTQIDIIIQSAVAAINDAILISQALKGGGQ